MFFKCWLVESEDMGETMQTILDAAWLISSSGILCNVCKYLANAMSSTLILSVWRPFLANMYPNPLTLNIRKYRHKP